MEILIQRFTLRRNGIEYLPGDCLEIDDEEGEKIIKDAKGAIIEVKHKRQRKKTANEEKQQPKPPQRTENEECQDKDGENGQDADKDDEEGEEISLPDIDIAKAISKGGKKK